MAIHVSGPYALDEPLFQDLRTTRLVPINRKFVRDWTSVPLLFVVDLKLNWSFCALRFDAIEAAASTCVERLLNSCSEAIGQKAKRVKQGAFSRAILPNHGGHRSERFGFLQAPEPCRA